MWITFLTTLEQMTRIFVFLLLGFGLNRLNILPKGAGAGISKVVTVVFLPALLFHSNVTEFNILNIGLYGKLVLLGGVLWLAVTIAVVPLAKKFAGNNQEDRGAYLYALSIPNTGSVGTPVVLALFGATGLLEYNLFLFIWSMMTYAWGVNLFTPHQEKMALSRRILQVLNPAFVASCLGLLLGALGAKNWLPSMALNIVGDLSACYVPIALLMAGYTVANYPLGNVFKLPKSYLFTFLRLISIPVVMMLLCLLLGMEKSVATLVLLGFACPCGINVVVFPAAYGKDCQTGASLVLISSLASILTIPALYALLQYLFV